MLHVSKTLNAQQFCATTIQMDVQDKCLDLI